MHEVQGYPRHEERGRLGVDPKSRPLVSQGDLGQERGDLDKESHDPGRVGGVRRGGRGGSTKSSGTFKGDMHEVQGYPRHEERGRLGLDPRS